MPTIDDLDGFRIDPELRNLIPTDMEGLRGLTENIKKAGRIRDKVTVWVNCPDGPTLVDGHSRLEARDHLAKDGIEIPAPEYEPYEFDSVFDAKVWMVENQDGRRNLNAEQRKALRVQRDKLIAEFYESIKGDAKANLKRGNAPPATSTESPKNHGDTSGKPSGKRTSAPPAKKAAAEKFNVSTATVGRAVRAQKPKPATKKTPPKPNEFVKVVADAKSHFGKLVRTVDDFSNKSNSAQSPAHRRCLEHLSAFQKEWLAWTNPRVS